MRDNKSDCFALEGMIAGKDAALRVQSQTGGASKPLEKISPRAEHRSIKHIIPHGTGKECFG